ncbi:MAG: serine hydrolase domain-containing protein [Eubacterium sp.]|nr:serine hydrolase domain-containing protein [Eubacterium sp.]
MNNKRNSNKKRMAVMVAALGVAGAVSGGFLWGSLGESGCGKAVAVAQTAGQDVAGGNKTGLADGWKTANEELVYCVGSVSKVYVTAAVMRLVDEEKVKLDTPVTTYIPEFKMADPRYKDITVRMLMDHTSGIMGTSRRGMLLYADDDSLHLDTILETLSTQRLKAAPGAYATYCNDGFDLLGILVERVSGIPYTEYVKRYIAAPTGGSETGTGYNCEEFDNLVPCFTPTSNRLEDNICTSLGAGGVYATASDVTRFGSAFFSGEKALLSEKAKTAMATRWNGAGADPSMDKNGLGWDKVGREGYDEAGIQLLGKGGDVGLNHAYLLVAPDEKISISVLSNGGASALNGILSYELMRVIMEDRGIQIPEQTGADIEPVSDIPDSYDVYAGTYVVSNTTGETIDEITFPDHKYMHVVSTGAFRQDVKDYVLTADGDFVELAYEVADSGLTDMRLSMNPARISFRTGQDGKQLISAVVQNIFPEIGTYADQTYVGEKMEENPVDESVIDSWRKLCGIDLCLMNEIYSSASYDAAVSQAVLPEGYPGYIFIVSDMGIRLLKIVDDKQAVSFQIIPSSRSRDQVDIKLQTDGDGITMVLSDGTKFCTDAAFPEFDGSEKEISLETGRAKWYRVADTAVNSEIAIAERPENSAVYVFNKYGEIVYTSHILGMTNTLPIPEGGKILFLGEAGGSIKLK